MIYCAVYIDYFPQLDVLRPAELAALHDELRGCFERFGGEVSPKAHPIAAAFRDDGPFSRFLIAEAAACAQDIVRGARGFAVGALVCMCRADSPEDAALAMAGLRLASFKGMACLLSDELRAFLREYLRPAADGSPWYEAVHRSAIGGAQVGAFFEPARSPDPTWERLGEALESEGRLVSLEGYRPTRMLSALAAEAARRLDPRPVVPLRAYPSAMRTFSPLVEALGPYASLAEPGNEADGDAALEGNALAQFAASVYSDALDGQRAAACARALERILDALSERGAVLICDAPKLFGEGARRLIAKRLREGIGSERYLAISPGETPDEWLGRHRRTLSVEAPERAAFEEALGAALGEGDYPARGPIGVRIARLAGRQRPGRAHAEGDEALLGLLPKEAALYLYVALACEGFLDEKRLDELFASLGLGEAGSRALSELLARAGFLEEARGSVLRPLAAGELRAAAAELLPALDRAIDAYLLSLYRRGELYPNGALLKRLGEGSDRSLAYDCVFNDSLGSRAEAPALEASSLGAELGAAHGFWSALRRRDPAAAEDAAAALRAVGGELARGLAACELAYARGDADGAGKGARVAILALEAGQARKLQLRAHRLIGMATLASGRATEAADYLSNAQELAESYGDRYERMLAAYGRAVVEFMAGALVKAAALAGEAEEAASRCALADYLCAIRLFQARIRFELGAYEACAEACASIGRLATRYGLDAEAKRASAWRGRALAYAARGDEAEFVLRSLGDDREARAFLAEAAALRGDYLAAARVLEGAPPGGAAARAFQPADAVAWHSLFTEHEGRCAGFGDADRALADFEAALRSFCLGMATGDGRHAAALYAMLREEAGRHGPNSALYCYLCYRMEEELEDPPVDRQTVLSRAFKALQQRSGKIEERFTRSLYMESNYWNARLLTAAREHKFI